MENCMSAGQPTCTGSTCLPKTYNKSLSRGHFFSEIAYLTVHMQCMARGDDARCVVRRQHFLAIFAEAAPDGAPVPPSKSIDAAVALEPSDLHNVPDEVTHPAQQP